MTKSVVPINARTNVGTNNGLPAAVFGSPPFSASTRSASDTSSIAMATIRTTAPVLKISRGCMACLRLAVNAVDSKETGLIEGGRVHLHQDRDQCGRMRFSASWLTTLDRRHVTP